MLKPLPWSPAFENPFLGTVIENHEISRGFHGVVSTGALEERDVVTNVPRLRMKSVLRKFTLDSLLLHLHVQGDYAVTSDGLPRLVPARMPEIAVQFLKRTGWTFAERSQLAVSMLSGRLVSPSGTSTSTSATMTSALPTSSDPDLCAWDGGPGSLGRTEMSLPSQADDAPGRRYSCCGTRRCDGTHILSTGATAREVGGANVESVLGDSEQEPDGILFHAGRLALWSVVMYWNY